VVIAIGLLLALAAMIIVSRERHPTDYLPAPHNLPRGA